MRYKVLSIAFLDQTLFLVDIFEDPMLERGDRYNRLISDIGKQYNVDTSEEVQPSENNTHAPQLILSDRVIDRTSFFEFLPTYTECVNDLMKEQKYELADEYLTSIIKHLNRFDDVTIHIRHMIISNEILQLKCYAHFASMNYDTFLVKVKELLEKASLRRSDCTSELSDVSSEKQWPRALIESLNSADDTVNTDAELVVQLLMLCIEELFTLFCEKQEKTVKMAGICQYGSRAAKILVSMLNELLSSIKVEADKEQKIPSERTLNFLILGNSHVVFQRAFLILALRRKLERKEVINAQFDGLPSVIESLNQWLMYCEKTFPEKKEIVRNVMLSLKRHANHLRLLICNDALDSTQAMSVQRSILLTQLLKIDQHLLSITDLGLLANILYIHLSKSALKPSGDFKTLLGECIECMIRQYPKDELANQFVSVSETLLLNNIGAAINAPTLVPEKSIDEWRAYLNEVYAPSKKRISLLAIARILSLLMMCAKIEKRQIKTFGKTNVNNVDYMLFIRDFIRLKILSGETSEVIDGFVDVLQEDLSHQLKMEFLIDAMAFYCGKANQEIFESKLRPILTYECGKVSATHNLPPDKKRQFQAAIWQMGAYNNEHQRILEEIACAVLTDPLNINTKTMNYFCHIDRLFFDSVIMRLPEQSMSMLRTKLNESSGMDDSIEQLFLHAISVLNVFIKSQHTKPIDRHSLEWAPYMKLSSQAYRCIQNFIQTHTPILEKHRHIFVTLVILMQEHFKAPDDGIGFLIDASQQLVLSLNKIDSTLVKQCVDQALNNYQLHCLKGIGRCLGDHHISAELIDKNASYWNISREKVNRIIYHYTSEPPSILPFEVVRSPL